jgi:uncharacterized protein (TIGR02996 family)
VLPPIVAVEVVEPIDPATDAHTRSTLLDACYRDPGDTLAREVYADYLLLRGDPRGEMIALQLADREPERVAQLIATHSHKWLGPLKRELHDIVFERGFPARARVDAWTPAMHALLRDTPAAATIRGLAIERVIAADLERLCADPVLASRVASLGTRDVPIAEVLGRLVALPNLTSLALRVTDPNAPVALRRLWDLRAGRRLVALSCTSIEVAPWLDLLADAPPALQRMSIVMQLYTVIAPTTVVLTRDASDRFSAVEILPGPDEARLGDMLVHAFPPALRGHLTSARVTTQKQWRTALVNQLTEHFRGLDVALAIEDE